MSELDLRLPVAGPSAPQVALITASLLGAAAMAFVEPVLAPVLLLVPTAVVVLERTRADAVTFLTGLVLAFAFIPSGSVVGPLGAAGRPAALIGLAGLWWWVHVLLSRSGDAARGFQPVRLVAMLLVGAVVASMASAFTRPLTGAETSGIYRSALFLLGLIGALVVAADGIPSRERLDTLLRRLVAAATAVAGMGVLQFFTGVNLDAVFSFPGLTKQAALQGIQNRSDFNRVAATTSHPIEFGVVMGMVFPLAVHYALLHRRWWHWASVGLIAAAVPMSVSRSGMLAFGLGAFVLWASWPRQLKVRSLGIAVAFALVMRLAVPGLLGTIRSLFTNFFFDDSIKGRTSDYGQIGGLIRDHPFVGRGFGTFNPEVYFVLDNQYLGMLVETGIVGALLLIALFATGIGTAAGSRVGGDDRTRSLGQALAASIAAGAIAAGTFDLLAFGMVSMLVFLVIGCAGALWRLTDADRRRHRASQAAPLGAR